MNNTIRLAINDAHLLRFTYGLSQRVVEPYAYGIDEEGREFLRAYQVSGLRQGWRTYQADKIHTVSELEKPITHLRVDSEQISATFPATPGIAMAASGSEPCCPREDS